MPEQVGPLHRVRRRGPRLPDKAADVVRLLEKVRIVPGGCWEWQARIEDNGYGYFRLGEIKYAHRAAYTLLVGPIPEGLTIDHLCEKRSCIRPDHLEAVTHAENVARAAGRWETCDRLHPDTETRIGMKNKRPYCLECGRITEKARRDRAREQMAQRVREIGF